ncbi:hypothetical protein SARC_08796 [Sphaeroforma arctica JP610]|uniref:C2 NT-type domain-containing protein n=1 Tax=Sphaeroforma arctica JP610 TaxID=667725 RepID=A0A0L0FQF7_9EUKA|nr:hypothetical protein SARC_08796 [Sphaeroforma arctica JP610]KNC78781.1 hypothetical protein SARC_08796 [Sphaeroforma arctica JP610]|eukprot:XP_014152683.1 hypothetical protein SARC_08796 [Sphaeroforma arctica JP610]
MGKKKERKFLVEFHIFQLSSIPSRNGSLRASLQLGKRKIGITHRREISSFKVEWDQTFDFKCGIPADDEERLLPCICGIKIYKETRFGNDKLGVVKVDLSEFAGRDGMERRYILSGDESHKRRKDNSILQIKVSLTLVSGDPIFKTPQLADETTATGPAQTKKTTLEYALGFDPDAQLLGQEIVPRAAVTRPHISSTRVNPKAVVEDLFSEQLQANNLSETKRAITQSHNMRFSELNMNSI